MTSSSDNTGSTLAGALLPMRPFVVEKIWGGGRLHAMGKVGGTEGIDRRKVGEAWEVADLKTGQSCVAQGRFAGRELGDLVREFGADLVGTAASDPSVFPLLVKLIDANADLSVQVHPNAAQAKTRVGALPKDECWLVLETDPGARLAHGFVDDDVSEQSFRQALEAKKPERLLRIVDVKPGDILRVSPGTVHAIGSGVFLLEVQEPSDTTYRVWDYERRGLDGKTRDLHLEDALAVLQFGKQTPALVSPAVLPLRADAVAELLVDAPRYRLETLTLGASLSGASATAHVELISDATTPLVVTILEGRVSIQTATEEVVAKTLDSVVIPAACGAFVVASTEKARLSVAGLAGRQLINLANDTNDDVDRAHSGLPK